MAKKAIFELGENGIITDPNALLRRVYVLAQTADHSQSVLFSSGVMSMQYLASVYGSRPAELAIQLESAFKTKYQKIFPEGVSVTVKEKDPGNNARYTLSIDVSVVHEGNTYTLQGALFRDNNEDFTRLQDAIV